MDFGGIIYVVLFVGIFVFSLLKDRLKNKENREKRAAQAQAQTTAEEKNEQMREAWEKQWDRVLKDKVKVEEKKSVQKKSSDPFLTTEMNTYGSNSAKKGQSQRIKVPKQEPVRASVRKPAEKAENEFSFRSVEDARRAFIASEIWNRKYC